MSDKEFPNGLFAKAPHENAPDFVKCKISIKRADFGNWLRGKQDEWINLDVKVSQDGKWYAEVDTWKPQPKGESSTGGSFEDGMAEDKFHDDKIPF
jgi:hypothetical protein